MITSMMCSTMIRVTPVWWIFFTSAIACCNSVGVRPASASSSSISRGPVASTRAISSRLRPGVPSERARCALWRAKPVISMIRNADSRASRRWRWWRNAPTITLSRTVISSNVAGTWNVRPMPARACASADERVTSTPSNSTRPVVGTVSPARQLKKVDLPAPLGPISPMISPSATARSAPRTAKKLPNDLETFCALSSMLTPRQQGRHAMPPFVHAARLEPREQHDDAAIEDVSEARAAAAEPGIGRGLQRHQDQRTDERAEQRPRAAQGGDDHHLHRHQNAKTALRVDKPGLDRIERAGERGKERAQHQRLEFRLPHRHAEAARGALAGLDRAQIITETAAFDLEGRVEHDRQHGQKDVVVRQLAAEGEIPPAAPDRRSLQADRGADEIPRADEDADQLGDRDRGHAEIVALQAKRRHADHECKTETDENPGGNARDRRQAPQMIEQQRRIGADAEEHAVTDRYLPGIAADDVPGRCRDRREQKCNPDVPIERAGEDERIEQQQSRERREAPFHNAILLTPSPSIPAAATTTAQRTAHRRRCLCRSGRTSKPTMPGSIR